MQCVAVCCSVLQCVAVCCRRGVHRHTDHITGHVSLYLLSSCCSALQCVAMCCSALQCVAMCCSVPLPIRTRTQQTRKGAGEFYLGNNEHTCPYAYRPTINLGIRSCVHNILQKQVQTEVHDTYGVASVSRIDEILGLLCKRALYKRQYSAKETFNLIGSTDRSHLICGREVGGWGRVPFSRI